MPLLLRALELNELDLRSHVIDTLALLVRAAPEMVKSQAATIVDTLIKNAVCADAKDSEAAVVSPAQTKCRFGSLSYYEATTSFSTKVFGSIPRYD